MRPTLFPLQLPPQMGMVAIKMTQRSGDELAAVRLVLPGDEVVLGSERGRMARIPCDSVRVGA